MQTLVLLQATACFFLTGLIWTIQLVHYPTFLWVRKEDFSAFSNFHSFRISVIVIPLMITELITAGLLLTAPVPLLANKHVIVMNLVGVLLIWASTFFMSVPCHSRLSLGFSEKVSRRLVNTNWPRTLLWTVRSLLWFWILRTALIV